MRRIAELTATIAATLGLCLLAQHAALAQDSSFPLAPAQASTIAPRVDALFYTIFWLAAIIAGGVCMLIIFFAYKYRRGSPADRSNPPLVNVKLEATWIGIPILLSLGIFAWGARVFFDDSMPPPDAINITVIGKQWMWKLQHPEGQQELNELHVPVGRAIRLNMISQDVIHDFAVPAFRIRQDVLPGRYTTTWFQATKAGRYHLFCAQYCGTQHANMGGWIYVMEPADYEDWLSRTHVEPSLATEGARLFVQFSCTGCHAHSATVRAPSLNGLYEKPVPLSDGSVVLADDRYIHDSILLPGSQIVAGYQNIMPSFTGAMTEAQTLALVAYIKSLGRNQEQENTPRSLTNLTGAQVREMQQHATAEQVQMRPKLPPGADMPGRINALKPPNSSGYRANPLRPGPVAPLDNAPENERPQPPLVPESSGASLRPNPPLSRNPSGVEPGERQGNE